MKPAAAIPALLLAGVLLAGCGAPAPPDGDGDGLTDAQEAAGWGIRVTLANGTVVARHVTSDPGSRTTDGSALVDTYKYALGLDPRATDTDGDGLTDCQEVYDRDLADCRLGHAGPTDGGHATLANQVDTDGDGVGDGAEVHGYAALARNGTRTVTSDPLRSDTDRDGLLDGQEAATGADPRLPDSDGDGCRDGLDVDPLHDLRLHPGLLAFHWNGSAAARLQFVVNVGGANWRVPAEGGVEAAPGQNVSLAGLPAEPAPPTCSFSPVRPWLPIQVLAYRVDGTPGRIDLGAGSQGEAGHLDGRSGGLVHGPQQARPAGPLRLQGADGTLWLAPQRWLEP